MTDSIAVTLPGPRQCLQLLNSVYTQLHTLGNITLGSVIFSPQLLFWPIKHPRLTNPQLIEITTLHIVLPQAYQLRMQCCSSIR